MIDVLFISLNKEPVTMEIENSLLAMKKLINGRIEIMDYPDDERVYVIYNKEQQRINPNRVIDKKLIYGDFILVGNNIEDGDFKSLSKEQIRNYNNVFDNQSIICAKRRYQAHMIIRNFLLRKTKKG